MATILLNELEANTHLKKEGTKEDSLISEELRDESKKPAATRDVFNRNTLSNGKQEDKFKAETPDTIGTEDKSGISNKAEHSGFKWENIRIDKEPVDSLLDPPKLFNELEANTHLKKEGTKEDSLISEELRDESKKPAATRDVFNWNTLVIGKQEDKFKAETPDTVGTEDKSGISNKAEHSGYKWGNIRIDKEPIDSLLDSPKLFDEVTEEDNTQQKGDDLSQESELSQVDTLKPKEDKLVVDKEKLLITQKASSRAYSSYVPKVRPKERGSKISLSKRITTFFVSLFILFIIISASVWIMITLELIPKDKADWLTTFILSKLPIRIFERLDDSVVVSQDSGRWVSTRNGFIYVVSGSIENKSKHDVSYIKIKGEFLSGGKRLYEQVAYAGNTFSDTELKTLPFEYILNKLQRKNGDINFNYPRKLAGLNYDIKPDETVPFFIVFPSKGKVLGLKYKIDIVDFEKASLE